MKYVFLHGRQLKFVDYYYLMSSHYSGGPGDGTFASLAINTPLHFTFSGNCLWALKVCTASAKSAENTFNYSLILRFFIVFALPITLVREGHWVRDGG